MVVASCVESLMKVSKVQEVDTAGLDPDLFGVVQPESDDDDDSAAAKTDAKVSAHIKIRECSQVGRLRTQMQL